MMPKDSFDPSSAAAALTTKEDPIGGGKNKKKAVNATQAAALHGVNPKNQPVIQPPAKSGPPQKTILQGGGLPSPNDPYWNQSPTLTQDKFGSHKVEMDSLMDAHNPNTLPKQMLPPSPTGNYSKTDDPDVYMGKHGFKITREDYKKSLKDPNNDMKFVSFEEYANWLGGWAHPAKKDSDEAAKKARMEKDYYEGYSTAGSGSMRYHQ